MDPLSDYLRTLRTDYTRETYSSSIRLVVGDGNKFLALAKRNRKAAESQPMHLSSLLRQHHKQPVAGSAFVAAHL